MIKSKEASEKWVQDEMVAHHFMANLTLHLQAREEKRKIDEDLITGKHRDFFNWIEIWNRRS